MCLFKKQYATPLSTKYANKSHARFRTAAKAGSLQRALSNGIKIKPAVKKQHTGV